MKRFPPHAIDAERLVLGAVLNEPALLDEVNDILIPDHFYEGRHRLLFSVIQRLATTGIGIDIVSVSEAVREQTSAGSGAADLSYIGNLAVDAIGMGNALHHARSVRQQALLRQLLTVCSKTIDEVHEPNGMDAETILDRAEQRLFSLKLDLRTGRDVVVPLSNVLPRYMAQLEERSRHPGVSAGLSSGFIGLDAILGGFHAGDLVIVAGRPGMGKTSLAMNFAEHAALTLRQPVLVFSMEMPIDQLVTRLLASFGRIPQSHLRSGELTNDEWSRLSNAVGQIDDAPLFIDETPSLDPGTLRSRARKVSSQYGLKLIVVDYLGLMQIPGFQENRTQLVGDLSRNLKALAKELRVPVIVLSQLNRTIESREDKEPRLSDLRDSGAIEQDADVILFVQRDAFFNRNLQEADQSKSKIVIAKHRNGPIGEVEVQFNSHLTRFEDVEKAVHK